MDYKQRDMLIRRIVTGKLYASVNHQGVPVDVVFTDPSNDILVEADHIYKRSYEQAKANGDSYTLEESYSVLKDQGIWTDKHESELKVLQTSIEKMQDQLEKSTFQKKQQVAIKKTIDIAQERIDKLSSIKNQLYGSTIDHLADQTRRRFIIKNITKIQDIKLLSIASFLDLLVVCYYRENAIEESTIRELARTNPWRLYWTASKGFGTPLFRHPSTEMTEPQFALCMWSKIYDFAYDSSNRPTEDVIEDDKKFDAWYRSESKRIETENKKNALESQFGNGTGGVEIFVPADEEGAKEVYEMNDMNARSRIQQREKAIVQKGTIKEGDLPDVQSDLRMEVNRMASESIQRR